MKNLFKHVRILSMAAALALAVQPFASFSTATDVHAVETIIVERAPMMMTGGGGGSSSGGWIIGGVFFSVASIIACAMIVGAEEDREMTLEEALLSGVIPLGCLFREALADSE